MTARKYCCALLALCCGRVYAQPAPGVDGVDLLWGEFDLGDKVYAHATLSTYVDIAGNRCVAQIDTGANYKFLPTARRTTDVPLKTLHLQLASIATTIQASDDFERSLKNCGKKIVGSIGNAMFENGTLFLDLGKSKLYFRATAVLREDRVARDVTYMKPPGWEGGYLVVNYDVDEHGGGRAYLDTGAALFSFVTFSDELFDVLQSGAVTRFSAPAGQQAVACSASAMRQGLRVEGMVVAGTLGRCVKPPHMDGNVSGIVGLAGLENKLLILDYLSQKWKINVD